MGEAERKDRVNVAAGVVKYGGETFEIETGYSYAVAVDKNGVHNVFVESYDQNGNREVYVLGQMPNTLLAHQRMAESMAAAGAIYLDPENAKAVIEAEEVKKENKFN